MKVNKILLKQFFAFIKERQNVWFRKQMLGLPYPWTGDVVLRDGYFCNVYRELDKCTKILMDEVLYSKQPMAYLLFNTITFRMFNRPDFFDWCPPIAAENFDLKVMMSQADKHIKAGGKVFSSAYQIAQFPYWKTNRPHGKHVQVAHSIKYASKHNNCLYNALCRAIDGVDALQLVRDAIPLVGPFIAYQVILDLTYVPNFFYRGITDNDYMLVGPGALPALKDLFGDVKKGEEESYLRHLQECMFEYIDAKRWEKIIPEERIHKEKELSLNNIEFCLCEFRKYCAIKNGRKLKRKYRIEEHA